MIFHSLQLESFCHETEDEEKVRKAMLNLLPESIRNRRDPIRKDVLRGTYDNKITILKIEFRKQGDVKKIFNFILENLNEKESDKIAEEMDGRVDDDCNFFIRFDKQEAYCEKLVLGSRDSIQLKGKVAAYPANRMNAVKIMRGAWS